MERSGVLPTTQFAYRKSLGTCDTLLCVSYTLQSAYESLKKARIVQIDFGVSGECFGPVIVPPVYFGGFFHSGK